MKPYSNIINLDFQSARQRAPLTPADSEGSARSIRIAPGRAVPILHHHDDMIWWSGFMNGAAWGVMAVSLIAVLTWPG